MNYAVELTRRARIDLARLDLWPTLRDRRAAVQLADLLEATFDSLTTYPLRGRPLGETTRELAIPFGQAGYVLRYDVIGQRVFITRILHSLEDR